MKSSTVGLASRHFAASLYDPRKDHKDVIEFAIMMCNVSLSTFSINALSYPP